MANQLPNPPTQVRRPWRATFRTLIIAGVALLPLIPQIAATADIDEIPAVASVLAGVAILNRVITLPGVEAWLQRFAPWLAAGSYDACHRMPKNQPITDDEYEGGEDADTNGA